jgi:gamma-glutamyltranspeptidase/glutathione hydrolase
MLRAQAAPRPQQRVEAEHGVVAAAHPAAAAAGLAMLERGGNAVDAAVATAFALGVVEPMMAGVGGGGSLTLWLADSAEAWHVEFYAASGSTPDAGLDTLLAVTGGRDSLVTPERLVAVPGAVAGLLAAHERYGRLPRAQVLAPAVTLARDGFLVHPVLARVIDDERDKLHDDPRAAAVFYPNGEPLQAGDSLVQPELAVTLERIAERGRDGYYTGPTAQALAETLRAGDNPITRDDLARYTPRWRRPLCATYRSYTVLTAPPPLAGVQVLQTLRLLEPLALHTRGLPIEDPHVLGDLVDAIRIARADYAAWIGDPRDVGVPAVGIVSRRYAEQRSALLGVAPVPEVVEPGDPWDEEVGPLEPACASVGAFPPTTLPRPVAAAAVEPDHDGDAQTTHLSVVDADGNAVSLTYTLGLYFGSGVYSGGAFYNDASENFSAVAANRRGVYRVPRSSTTPTIVLQDDRVKLVVGSPGSGRIAPAIVHTIVYVLDHGLDLWTAVAMPRIYPFTDARTVRVEVGFTAGALAGLRARGYQLDVILPFDLYFGGVHAVLVREDGTLVGVADPRRDGAAVGY